jgi:hypothetical protein
MSTGETGYLRSPTSRTTQPSGEDDLWTVRTEGGLRLSPDGTRPS